METEDSIDSIGSIGPHACRPITYNRILYRTMPELPEVQNFRRLLLPLVSKDDCLRLERHNLERAPPRRFISDEQIEEIHATKFVVADVLRKGKLICMVLTEKSNRPNNTTRYLFLHMGMTGRISTPECIPKLQELSDADIYPPPHTYLRLVAGSEEACFSDPRKFGAIYLKDALEDEFRILAPDAWTSTIPVQRKTTKGGTGDDDDSIRTDILSKLTHKSLGIKAILLNQKRALCGVGNWVADEVLYQTKLHPDQNHLTNEQGEDILNRLYAILDEAVGCLSRDEEFPKEWLFHYRWNKRGRSKSKDAHGRAITFVTSGGRTSAIVPSIQSKKSWAPTKKNKSKKKGPQTKGVASSKNARTPVKSEEPSPESKTTQIKQENVPKTSRKTTRKRKGPQVAAKEVDNGRTKRRSPRLVKS